jgi:hypothetical protein
LHEASPYLLAGALAQLVAGALALRRARSGPAAAAGLLTAGLLAAALPALAAWALIGPTGALLLPSPRILLLPPLAALALAVQGLCAAALVAVEYHRARS